MNTRIYNTVNVHKRMLHKCVNTEVIVGSLSNFNTLYMTRSCGSTNQNRVSRSVKTVHTSLFANICKLHKLAT